MLNILQSSNDFCSDFIIFFFFLLRTWRGNRSLRVDVFSAVWTCFCYTSCYYESKLTTTNEIEPTGKYLCLKYVIGFKFVLKLLIGIAVEQIEFIRAEHRRQGKY